MLFTAHLETRPKVNGRYYPVNLRINLLFIKKYSHVTTLSLNKLNPGTFQCQQRPPIEREADYISKFLFEKRWSCIYRILFIAITYVTVWRSQCASVACLSEVFALMFLKPIEQSNITGKECVRTTTIGDESDTVWIIWAHGPRQRRHVGPLLNGVQHISVPEDQQHQGRPLERRVMQ
jgi:hypothetical protein